MAVYHPADTSRAVTQLAPRARLVERWKDDPTAVGAAVRSFLAEHAAA